MKTLYTAVLMLVAMSAQAEGLVHLECSFDSDPKDVYDITLDEANSQVTYSNVGLNLLEQTEALFTPVAVKFYTFTISRVDLSFKSTHFSLVENGDVTNEGKCKIMPAKPLNAAF